jgi:hypothetical protein
MLVAAETCLPSYYPEMGCITLFIKNPLPQQLASLRDRYPATGLRAKITTNLFPRLRLEEHRTDPSPITCTHKNVWNFTSVVLIRHRDVRLRQRDNFTLSSAKCDERVADGWCKCLDFESHDSSPPHSKGRISRRSSCNTETFQKLWVSNPARGVVSLLTPSDNMHCYWRWYVVINRDSSVNNETG